MGGQFLAAEFVTGVDEAIGAAVDVGIVDLGGVADHDELGALRHAGDDGLGLERGQLLGLVEDEEAVRDRSAADVAEGLDLEESALDELLVRLEWCLASPVAVILLLDGLFFLLLALGGVGSPRAFVPLRMEGKEYLEGVVDRLEPGVELLVECAGEESEGVSHGDHGAADGHAIVLALSGEVESRGHGHEGLAGSRLAIAGDQRDGGVEQGVEEAELSEIRRAEFDAARHLETLGNLQALEVAVTDMAGGHELLL